MNSLTGSGRIKVVLESQCPADDSFEMGFEFKGTSVYGRSSGLGCKRLGAGAAL